MNKKLNTWAQVIMEAQHYQLMTYYGIFYHIEVQEDIFDVLSGMKNMAPITTDEAQVHIGGVTMILDYNTDDVNRTTLGYIYVDEMSMTGLSMIDPSHLHMEIDPHALIKLEKRYSSAVNMIKGLFQKLQLILKDPGVVAMGWRTIICAWDD